MRSCCFAALNSENINDTAAKLGIPSATLHNWAYNARRTRHDMASNDSVDIKQVNINDLAEEIKDLK
jgi:hypothetical protein